jgi:hypothetical protein
MYSPTSFPHFDETNCAFKLYWLSMCEVTSGSQIGCERKLGETRRRFIGLKKKFGYEQNIGFFTYA